MLKIQKFVFNFFAENTYVIWCDETNECAIVDAGCYHDFEREELTEYIKKNNLSVQYLLNTHCHIDHVLGSEFVLDTYNPEYLIPEKDAILLERFDEQTAMVQFEVPAPRIPDKFLSEETTLKIGNISVEFLFTPGHTPGELCFYFPDEKKCLTGDVLFQGSIGRTDLSGGDFDTLINSINTKLLSLDDDVIIYPGHGEESKIGIERKSNPFLKEFINSK